MVTGSYREVDLDGESTPADISPEMTRRNIAFGTANQGLVEAAMTLAQPSMVLTLFVKALGGSNFLVGLIPSLRFFGWLAPQFLVAGSMRRLSRFLPMVRALESVRSSFYLIIAWVAVAYGRDNPPLVLGIFLVLFIITRFAAGSSAVARAEIVARMVPPGERATVVSLRKFAGGFAGFLSGFAVRYVLDDRVSRFPFNYAILIGLAGILFGLAMAVLNLVVEPELPIPPRRIDAVQQLKRAPALLRTDRRYLLYVGVQAASTGLELAAPFYVIYATEELGAPAAMVGTYIAVRTFAQVLSNLFWGRQCRRRGNLWVLRAGRVLAVLAAGSAVGLSVIVPLVWADRIPIWTASLFGIVFFTQGLSGSADAVSRVSYLYEMAPERDRPTYIGLANTIVGPLYFLPAMGGALLDRVGYTALFAAAAASLILSYFLSVRLGATDLASSALK